jgi:hypothetical protein
MSNAVGCADVEPEWPIRMQSGQSLKGVADERGKRHRPELGIDQPHLMAGVDQRTAQRQQAERRQMVVRHTAADGGVRRIDEDDFHDGPSWEDGPEILVGDLDLELAPFSSFRAAFPQKYR